MTNFNKISSKWQKAWEKEKIFQIKEDKNKKKYFSCEFFPYPSSYGLHMGHAFNYIIGDIHARFKRMQGFNVLYPMGYDSFGLPAENAAIKAKIHPRKYTEKAIKNFIKQQKNLGLSYDWLRIIKTSDPSYYKWNQYLFLKLLEKGLVYRKEALVNWCPKCETVLANEQVHNGKCWRHKDTDVTEKNLEQWFIRITKYANELLKEVPKLKWPERIKTMQENWIGKSKGIKIKFKIKDFDEELEVFTTRPDTIYGVTFLVYSIYHPKVLELSKATAQEEKVKNFLENLPKQKPEDKDKEGVFIGRYAIHPLTNEEIPIYASNFVVSDYATGIVMGVPAHDQRDFEFAKKHDIWIKLVIQNSEGSLNIYRMNKAYTDPGKMVNSAQFSGLNSEEAKEKISQYLKENNLGYEDVQYKLKDWLVSRQRYWGTPIPIIYCDKCGIVPVPEKDLPVKLPEKVKFGKGNPLTTNEEFLNTKCPNCRLKAKRETDTMDTFFDSSWYFLRYCDPNNNKEPFDLNKVKYWMPVDQYIGGAEHACMHLIYARFFTKALRDIKFLKINEPFISLFNQGMLHKDGFKMSKSRGNVVSPEEVSEKYGIDTGRLFLVSIASPDKDMEWSDKGIQGSLRFINKLMDYFNKVKLGKTSKKIESKLNKTIKEYTEDLEEFRYNLAVIKLRALFESFENRMSKKDLESFIKLLSPICPHISEELWHKLGNKTFVSLEKWPKYDAKKIDKKLEEQENMIKKISDDINQVKKILKKNNPKIYLYVIPSEFDIYRKHIDELKKSTSSKEIIIFTTNNRDLHDPQNKAKKAKPGKPAIYIE